ncbi:MAG: Radical SAM domain heme biosynthesis protein [Candidatus Ozemobacter sibiricus]|jgi:radical SAM protein with 4Fe4S-binding SPASM domain|uniref:Radical SAM domain heme biosynthesis protein n=1 Tax=Candidatus Ozemobacter sibiricus TaxID=2268124 RepID=A0A367ZRV6_9BACT|nr:MAG: Radical SAM domain heme biosynthesis protein [Candidatus Ozemobacter sibiricus]
MNRQGQGSGHPGGVTPGHPGEHPGRDGGGLLPDGGRRLQLLAWETTQACTLACPHCRADACLERPAGELTTDEGRRLLREAARVGPGIIILSGGEPLLRDDLEDLAAAGTAAGHTVVVATNDGRLLTRERIASLREAGVRRYSFSVHFPDEEGQDAFTGRPGTLQATREAFARLRAAGIGFQINTTVMRGNAERLEEIRRLALDLGAAAWHLFFVVPTGRAAAPPRSAPLTDSEIEKVLRWAAGIEATAGLPMKITCAPHYARIKAEMGLKNTQRGRGCMAGDGFAFVSSRGEVKPCGYFDLSVGNVRQTPFDVIYREAPVFRDLRQPDRLEGACGACAYRKVCGGCRARALAVSGRYLGDDPHCPRAHASRSAP